MPKTFTLTLISNRARARNGHPWVYANEVKAPLPPECNGGTVNLVDERGRNLGSGIYNGHSQILWRRISNEADVPMDASFLRQAVTAALARRTAETAQRLVWSEADNLPGLVVDRYGTTLCAQCLTLAMDKAIPTLAPLLIELTGAKEIVWRNDAPSREHEGLPLEQRTHTGKPLAPFAVNIGGLDYTVDLVGGHKTGFYLDQREQHPIVATYAKGRKVLDAFCNQGAFALHCAKAGATSALGLDITADCITLATANAKRNKLDATFREQNVFDYFTENREDRYGLIILDPPSFARNQKSVDNALRGYKELHLRALQRLEPGGILATYCCSQHVSRDFFQATLSEAAADAKRTVRILRYCSQPLDHPVVVTIPETEYLKGMIVQAE
ncbi:MAG: class I SAM-dependent rRNA methyltransferase [Verrucomicrobiota bacterium]|nr:class I SAM-dependent rRNA methyltransferase [Verrucomicrobiota bacterium]